MQTSQSTTDTLGWLAQQIGAAKPAALARIVSVTGFGGKRSGELMGVSLDESVGELALGAANEATTSAARTLLRDRSHKAIVVSVPVGDADAVAAGLACGGNAVVLIEVAKALPPLFWKTVGEAKAVVLASYATGSIAITATQAEGSLGLPSSTSETSETSETSQTSDTSDEEVTVAGRRMLQKGPIEMMKTIGDQDVFLTLLAPQPRLLVFGEAQLAAALVKQGNLVGWVVEVRSDRGGVSIDEAVTLAGSAGPLDGVVVLSHDIGASSSVLAAALNAGCGYVGALGSRHTQGARNDCLVEVHGLSSETRGRVHGPVGLNIGSRTPEETALAIVAEMIAARSAITLVASV